MFRRLMFQRKLMNLGQLKYVGMHKKPRRIVDPYRGYKEAFIYLTIFGLTLLGVSSISLLSEGMEKKTKKREINLGRVIGKHLDKSKENDTALMELRWRELRFYSFASVNYNGQIFMTPNDFLVCAVNPHPKIRLTRTVLTKNDLEIIKSQTPRTESTNLFHQLKNTGIISYTEYLFLMSALTKPRYSFEIAFKMFDRDRNNKVDKKEFLMIENILGNALRNQARMSDNRRRIVATFLPPSKAKLLLEGSTMHIDKKEFQEQRDEVDTTVLVHFFGKNGTGSLTLHSFRKFLDNLQTEVLTMEFNSFAKGFSTISEVDFANILLSYTTRLTEENRAIYLQRLLIHLDKNIGINLEDFITFMRFINNIDDFSLALRMYTRCDQYVDKEVLQRIVKHCTGNVLSKHVVDTVFHLFDVDNDGYLSHQEFVDIMKDRSKRGLKDEINTYGWNGFKRCFRREFNLI